MGVLLGILMALHFPLFMSVLDQFTRWYRALGSAPAVPAAAASPAPGLSPMQPWHHAAQMELRAAPSGPRRVLLQRLVDEGDAALELLAAAYSVSKRDALARVLGEHVVRINAAAWGM